MLIDGTDPFVAAKPNARLIKLLIRAHRVNTALIGSADLPFAALAKREGVSRSCFRRLLRLSYLAPDILKRSSTGAEVKALSQLVKTPTVRVVFDKWVSASY
jgi:hypothetical protein